MGIVKLYGTIRNWLSAPFRYPTLFWGFVHQEIRGRYAGSMGGLIWSIITPLSNMLIYIFVFSVVFKIRLKPMETGTESFVLYLLSGLLPWIAFSEAIGGSAGMFVGKAGLITKVAFPLEVVPVASVVVTFALNGIGFLAFLVYLTIEGYSDMTWLYLPIATLIFMIFTLGAMVLLASLSVFIRDIQQVIGSALSLWMYLTPILYPVTLLSEELQQVIYLNPVYPFIELYHQLLLKHHLPLDLLGFAIGYAVIAFLTGVWFYSRSRNAFADVL
jgi:lipopolysaccharide transport system permease protein